MTIRNLLLTITSTFSLFFASRLQAQLSVGATNANLCVGEFSTLYASDTNATAFIWSPTSTLSADTADSVFAYPSATTTYTVLSYNDTIGILDTASITITVNSYPTLTTVNTNREMCTGDTIHIDVSGANSYTWAGATTYLNATTGSSVIFDASGLKTDQSLIVTGANGNCTSTITINVEVDSVIPTISVLDSSSYVCFGKNTLLAVTGATSYDWTSSLGSFDSIINNKAYVSPTNTSQPTTYTVTGHIGNCSQSLDFSVITAPAAQFTISQTSNGLPVCQFTRDTVSFNGNTTHYALSSVDGTLYTSSDTVEYSVLKDQIVYVRGYTSYNCALKDSFNLYVDSTCVDSTYYVDGIKDLSDLSNQFKIYSSDDEIVIESLNSNTSGECVVFNLSGQQVYSFTHNGTISRNQTPSNLSSNVYIIYLSTKNGYARKKLYLN